LLAHGERAQLAALHMGIDSGNVGEHHVELPADEVGHAGRAALVGHVLMVDLFRSLNSASVRCGGVPLPLEPALSLRVLGRRDQALQVLDRAGHRHHDQHRAAGQQGDRAQVFLEAEGRLGKQRHVGRMRQRDRQQRVAVGRALATRSAPICPLPPGRLSTSTLTFQRSPSCWPICAP
jgi:hypothetical protein